MPNGASLHLTYLHDHLSLQTPLRALMIDRAKPMLSRIGSRFGIQGGVVVWEAPCRLVPRFFIIL